jgi:hypothetical protein
VEILAWLAVPFAVLVIALLWLAWTGRTKAPADMHETVADFARFRAALDGRPDPGGRHPLRRRR